MKYNINDLNKEQIAEIDNRLENFNAEHIGFEKEGSASVGIFDGDKMIAGAFGCMTVYNIFYIETVFVDENYRRQNLGSILMQELEKRAKSLGANTIRLDTFDWQGKDFYPSIGFEQVGFYENKEDGFSEYFFIKRI